MQFLKDIVELSRMFNAAKGQSGKPKNDIVRTLCGHISLQLYVRTMSAQHLTKDICLTRDIPREMLCGHFADIYLQGYMSALYPSSVFTSGLLRITIVSFVLFAIVFN